MAYILLTHLFTSLYYLHNFVTLISTRDATIGFIHAKKFVSFVNFSLNQSIIHKLLNQYQACLYLFECILHVDFKYGHEIPKCWHFFLKQLWRIVLFVCSRLPHAKYVNIFKSRRVTFLTFLIPTLSHIFLSKFHYGSLW